MTKLCKDCKWSRLSRLDWFMGGGRFAKCAHPKLLRDAEDTIRYDLVNGDKPKKLDDRFFCSVNREFGCGETGVFWELKS